MAHLPFDGHGHGAVLLGAGVLQARPEVLVHDAELSLDHAAPCGGERERVRNLGYIGLKAKTHRKNLVD